jgi:hypothetical protein
MEEEKKEGEKTCCTDKGSCCCKGGCCGCKIVIAIILFLLGGVIGYLKGMNAHKCCGMAMHMGMPMVPPSAPSAK